MPLDRNSPDASREVMQKCLPDAQVRHEVLELMVKCIRCCALKPHAWDVTLHDNSVAINIAGSLKCLEVITQKLKLFYLPNASTEHIAASNPFQVWKEVKLATIPQGDISGFIPILEPQILVYITTALDRYNSIRPHISHAHSPGVLRYIEQELELSEPLPNPIYNAESVQADRHYWAMQANPTMYDIQKAVQELSTDSWFVGNSKVKIGDRLIVWKAKGDEDTSGIISLAEVTREPILSKPNNIQYFKKPTPKEVAEEAPKNRAAIRYVRSDRLPIWKDNLPKGLEDISVANGAPGNVFRIQPEQWDTLMDYIGGWPEESEGDKNYDDPNQKMALNTILFGPPGTGKTYATAERAVQICKTGVPTEDREQVKSAYDNLTGTGQIAFVTFHQSYAYEDFVEGIRPVMDDEEETATPRYECKAGILKEAATKALYSILERAPTAPSNQQEVPFDALWERLIEKIEADPSHEYAGLSSASKFAIEVTERGNLRGRNIVSPNITSTYNSARKTMAEIYAKLRQQDAVSATDIRKALQRGSHDQFNAAIFRELKALEAESPQIKSDPLEEPVLSRAEKADVVQRYLATRDNSGYRLKPSSQWIPCVLIIDEINRGNISKILGELITLLEDDKRLGNENALTVTLPYSRDRFALPANLYIIGTMNTADKSIALVDLALRRRFEFEELVPDFNDEAICSYLSPEMRRALIMLNERIMLRKDRDHRIGHAFFVKVDSPDAFNKAWRTKVAPLLLEYFYGDWDGLRYVLHESGSTGKFIRPLGSPNDREVRNHWQWHGDTAEPVSDALAALIANYSLNDA